ncbi:MAG: fructose-bisphosphatase class III [Spirochaetota bacterium]
MRTFVLGDIHGAHLALTQCFDRSGFDSRHDHLIVLGDVSDRNPQTKEVIDTLLEVEHCDLITGNHDMWTLEWGMYGYAPSIWTSQGGAETIASYKGQPMPKAHRQFLRRAVPWLVYDDMLFVHGGFDTDIPLEEQTSRALAWNRSLMQNAWELEQSGQTKQFGGYSDIFAGHTPTLYFGIGRPIHACNVWNLDTGAGWGGRLTIMELESRTWYQSERTSVLYPNRPR